MLLYKDRNSCKFILNFENKKNKKKYFIENKKIKKTKHQK